MIAIEGYMKERKRMIYTIMGAIGGGVAGYLYYRIIGCNSGACPITSNPYISVIWGSLMGYLIFQK